MMWALLDFLDAWEAFYVEWKSEAALSAVHAWEKEVGGVWVQGHLNCSLPRDPVGVLLLLLFYLFCFVVVVCFSLKQASTCLV